MARVVEAILRLDPLYAALTIIAGIILFSSGIRQSNAASEKRGRDTAWIVLGAILILAGLAPLVRSLLEHVPLMPALQKSGVDSTGAVDAVSSKRPFVDSAASPWRLGRAVPSFGTRWRA